MKTLFLKIILLVLIVAGISLIFSACQQENIAEELNIEMLNQENNTNLNLRDPNILADNVSPGNCCGYVYGPDRYVNIDLDNLTYDFYCANGNNLYYKFYAYSNPTAPPIVEFSNSPTPTFCLPVGNYAMLICKYNNNCQLIYTNGDFEVPIGGSSSSPIYDACLPQCWRPIKK